MKEINADLIEQEVEKSKAILNAEVYKVIAKDSTSYKGILAVKVKHRESVVRIMSSEGSYFLDKYGSSIPVSPVYAANVPVVTGYFAKDFAVSQILPFVLFLDKDDFWKAQIEQIHVEKGGNVWLTPLVGDQRIELGSFDNFEKKLQNLHAFYVQVLAKNNWDKYQSVSVKYKDQVIAKKR